jgi:hypothetical protein
MRFGDAIAAWRARPARRRLAVKMRAGRSSGHGVELDRGEFMVMFDQMTRRQLKLSAKEFLARMKAGTLPDSEMTDYLVQLAGGRYSG